MNGGGDTWRQSVGASGGVGITPKGMSSRQILPVDKVSKLDFAASLC